MPGLHLTLAQYPQEKQKPQEKQLQNHFELHIPLIL